MKRFGLIALVAALGLVVAAPAAASSGKPAQAHTAKKCKRKHHKKRCRKRTTAPAPAPTTTAPPAPLPLTEAEVVSRVTQQAAAYCSADVYCTSSGHYFNDNADPSTARCSSKTTYSWTCEGWKVQSDSSEPPNLTRCDFWEVVERDGYDGIKSHQDTSLGSGGWDCYLVL
jgi:hypothetical protein